MFQISFIVLLFFSLLFLYTAGKSRFGSLLSLGHSPGKTDRLYMKGPGGRGEVEVAVSGVVGKRLFSANDVLTHYFISLSLSFLLMFWVKCFLRT